MGSLWFRALGGGGHGRTEVGRRHVVSAGNKTTGEPGHSRVPDFSVPCIDLMGVCDAVRRSAMKDEQEVARTDERRLGVDWRLASFDDSYLREGER